MIDLKKLLTMSLVFVGRSIFTNHPSSAPIAPLNNHLDPLAKSFATLAILISSLR